MLKFANRLTLEDVKAFIASNGFLVHELELFSTPRNTIRGTFNSASYKFEFLFDDNFFRLKDISYNSSVIKKFEEYEADISSEDWHCFMRERFGDEYVKYYFPENKSPYNINDIPTDIFLAKITLEDIWNLLGNRLLSVSCIKESKSFYSDKRRFKFYTGRETREVTISSFYDDSSIKRYISEEKFVQFMFEKFGEDFADYYLEIIKRIEEQLDSNNPRTDSNSICVYKENRESLTCKKYLAKRIFNR